MLARRSILVASLLTLACGSPPPPAPVTPAPLPVAKAEPAIDTSPVAAPPGLVLVARVSKPEALVSVVGSWTHLPLPTGPDLVRTIGEESIADIVDLSQPIDAAVTVSLGRRGVDGDGAFAVAVKDYESAKVKLGEAHKLVAGANGQYRVEGLGFGKKRAKGGDDDEDDCVLAPAPAGGRIVCGGSSALESLVPYLSRTLPKEKWSSDVHVEVRPEPVRAPLGELKSALPMLASGFLGRQSPAVQVLIDASLGEAIDIVNDVQLITLDSKVAESGVVLDTRLALQGKKSVMARALTSDRSGPAPAAFWHLPADTDAAVFTHGSDPKLFDHLREIVANLLLEGGESAGMPEAERKALKDVVVERLLPLLTNSAGLYAKGFDTTALDKALTAAKAAKDSDADDTKRALVDQVVGWHLAQVNEPIAKIGPTLKDVAALANRPALLKWAQSKQLDDLPKLKITGNPAGVTLPKETVHLEIALPRPDVEVPAKPGQKAPAKPVKKAQKPVVIHLLAVPDGGASWLAVGLDAKLVAQKVAASLSSALDTNTLGKVAGVESLREGKLHGGGFMSVRTFAGLAALGRRPPALSALPGKGTTPIFFSGRVEAPSATASAGAGVMTVTVPRAAIEDIVKLATSPH